MAMSFADRLLNIAVTATLTSAAWIVVGGELMPTREADETAAAPVAAEPAAAPTSPATAAPATAAPAPVAAAAGEALVVPVSGVRPDQLADTFGDERGGGARLHEALDIMAPEGTPVVAAAAGTVEKLFHSDAGGNTIYIRSPDRQTLHYYAHLRAYTPGLAEGQQVRSGERLGEVGASGNADPAAPHLHFAILRTTPEAEWWEPATAVDPYRVLVGR